MEWCDDEEDGQYENQEVDQRKFVVKEAYEALLSRAIRRLLSRDELDHLAHD